MKNSYVLLFLLFISFGSFAQKKYLQCGKIIDVKNGTVLSDKTIIVSGDKIESIENGFISSKDNNDKVIDLKNKTILPGLIDMHVHLEGETSPNNYLKPFTLNEADVAFNSAGYAKKTLMGFRGKRC